MAHRFKVGDRVKLECGFESTVAAIEGRLTGEDKKKYVVRRTRLAPGSAEVLQGYSSNVLRNGTPH